MARYRIDNRQEKIDFEIRDDEILRIVTNCKNLIMTRKGEVPYDRMRGLDPALYHKTADDVGLALKAEIARVLRWEPRANLINAWAEYDERGEATVYAEIEIRQ